MRLIHPTTQSRDCSSKGNKAKDTVINTVSLIILIPIVIVILAVAFVIFKLRYKIAKSNQALVISGGKKTKKAQQGPTVLVSGGAFISPFKRHEFFPLAVMTVSSDDKKTSASAIVTRRSG